MAAVQQTGIEGRVLSEDGAALVNAIVMISGASPPHPDIAALTDANGHFLLDHLVDGAYEVMANCDGFEGRVVTVDVQAGRIASVEIRLRR